MFRQIKVIYLGFISLLIGMRVTAQNFFAPAVTLDYPRKKKPMEHNFRGMVDLIPPDCVICYQCIKICPTAALFLSHTQKVEAEKKVKEITKFTFNAELCCFCGLCDEICPTDAIFMNKLYEVSAFSHDQILSIDLMNPNKYKHLDSNYSLDAEINDNKLRTVGIAPKPAPAAAAVAPAAGASQANPAAPAAPGPTTSTATETKPADGGPTTNPTTENKQPS
ncbi:MAG: hypothetical protein A2787_07630 [Omnitrophica WOR_2 bacterium RIFCSPHIGHO2_01_FULL_48_9]|nr:MAG: hypothetical protein A2787_07630 [Omnitrophica WOR_2 bacterium RIFCSPHIGHO2_01_FULL_48_9]